MTHDNDKCKREAPEYPCLHGLRLFNFSLFPVKPENWFKIYCEPLIFIDSTSYFRRNLGFVIIIEYIIKSIHRFSACI